MNETIQTMLNHRSIRNYTNQEVKEVDLNYILDCVRSAPSSINGQHVTIIVVKDEKNKAKLAELSGNQQYIAEAPVFLVFCMDYNRAKYACKKNNLPFATTESIESTLVGAIDVGLAMQNAIVSAESLGLGTVPIGGIRNNLIDVINILELPKYVFPLCGLVIGHISDHSAKKPRLPKKATIHSEKYVDVLEPLIDEYDVVMSKYMLDRTNGQSDRNWSQGIANSYKTKSHRKIKTVMKQQGFDNE